MIKKTLLFIAIVFLFTSCCEVVKENEETLIQKLEVSDNGRFLQLEDGSPFFWLGDTGWLLFTRLNREEAETYFDDRVAKGFNVIQVSAVHMIDAENIYGDSALINKSLGAPLVKDGHYGYWEHVDYLVDLAEEKGLYMALVAVWGNNVRGGYVSYSEAETYANFLVKRYGHKKNVIWMNGGDTFGNDSTATWNIIGKTLKEKSENQLVTYHPRGRHSSSDWFHNESWLDFNQVQSGHRRYDQDDTERGYGQDNWRYIEDDYKINPVKPTIDAEPSYEGIPQGLHDVNEVFWDHNDVRRYAYWSVFAGAFGYTYGHSAIMQFHLHDGREPAYGAKEYWDVALNSTGSQQMKHLKNLMLSKSYFDRVPAQEIIVENGKKYDYKVATKGSDYAFVYSYKGGIIKVDLSKLGFNKVGAEWYNPRVGTYYDIDTFEANGIKVFEAPGIEEDGNDWVLILNKK